MSEAPLPPFDRQDARVVRDPHATYRLYREREPVHRSPHPQARVTERVVLFRYAHVKEALSAPGLGRDWRRLGAALVLPEPLRPLQEMVYRFLLMVDPPEHERLRRPVSPAFRPRAVARQEGYVAERARALLGGCVARREMDVVADFALPLTIDAIGELMGVPEPLRRPIARKMRGLAPIFSGEPRAADLGSAAAAASDLTGTFEALLQEVEPHPRAGLLGDLAAAEGDEPTARAQSAATAIMIYGAGLATTGHAIANAILTLLARPEAWAWICEEPGRIPNAVEEILRFEPPVHRIGRIVYEDHELDGAFLRRGSMVILVLASANRDPDAFYEPDRLDLARDAREHLSFAWGAHSCLGAFLARLEMRVALEALVACAPKAKLAVAPDAVAWHAGAARGPARLPVRLG